MKEGVAMDIQELKSLIYQGEKVDIECKKAEGNIPKSVYESYSAFANTKGGYIILGVLEDKSKSLSEERYIIKGVQDPGAQKEDFWNTINGNKVNVNVLKDEDVFVVEEGDIKLLVIHVPRADFNMRPVYVGENPYKGTYKRNHEGDYHATEHEVTLKLDMVKTESAVQEASAVPKSAEEVPKSAEVENMTEQEKTIFEYVREHEMITTAIACKLLNIKERRAREILSEMCNKNYLKKKGATSNLRYIEMS
jgi:hypothetical protein